MHFSDAVKKITSTLCGEGGTLRETDVLISETGSRLFRALVEIDPLVTARAIEYTIENLDIEKLKLVKGKSRRNLVKALEYLCFWGNIFPLATPILFRFAIAENEGLANNATGQFLQLFRFTLSGTQASPQSRIFIIDDALHTDILEYNVLAVKALGTILNTKGFGRFIGAERQGSRPTQEEWKPDIGKEIKEIFDYWHEALIRITPIACGNDELAILAREQITNSLRNIALMGGIEELDNFLKQIINKRGPIWPRKALEKIIEVSNYKYPIILDKWRDALTNGLH